LEWFLKTEACAKPIPEFSQGSYIDEARTKKERNLNPERNQRGCKSAGTKD
jgi:hypothetical protein